MTLRRTQRDDATEAVSDHHPGSPVEEVDQVVDVSVDRNGTEVDALAVAAPVVANRVQVAQMPAASGERTASIHRAVHEDDERRPLHGVLVHEELSQRTRPRAV